MLYPIYIILVLREFLNGRNKQRCGRVLRVFVPRRHIGDAGLRVLNSAADELFARDEPDK